MWWDGKIQRTFRCRLLSVIGAEGGKIAVRSRYDITNLSTLRRRRNVHVGPAPGHLPRRLS